MEILFPYIIKLLKYECLFNIEVPLAGLFAIK